MQRGVSHDVLTTSSTFETDFGRLLIPPPLVKHCRELANATRYASSQAVRLAGHLTEIGKKTTETIHTHAVDIQSCIKFQINGQAGAFSSW